TTFLFTNHHDRFAIQTCDTADDGFVVTKMAITMQFIPIGKHAADVIRGIRTLRMAGNLDDVPGGQVGVNTFGQLGAFFAELGDLVRNIKVVGIANQLQLFDLAFKDRNRLFKIQIIQIHITNWLKVWDVALVIYSGATSDGLPGIAGTIRSPKIRYSALLVILRSTISRRNAEAIKGLSPLRRSVTQPDFCRSVLIAQTLQQIVFRTDQPGITQAKL